LFVVVAAALMALSAIPAAAQEPSRFPYPDAIPVLDEDNMRNISPNGEAASPAEELTLTEEEKDQIRAGDYSAVMMWYTDAPFFRAATAGATDVFNDLGIEVLGETNYEEDPAQLRAQVETVLALDPDIVLTVTNDPSAGAEAYRLLLDNGTKLVLMGTLPLGYQAGRDYVCMVTGDHYNMGKGAAELLAESIGGEGKVALIYHDADFYLTNRRDRVLKTTLVQNYPGIEIVDEQGVTGPDQGEEVANGILTRHPDVDAIYAPWDTVAEGVVAALRAQGLDDVKVVTIDLGGNMALDMAEDRNVYGMTAEITYMMGEKLATGGAYGLLGKDCPPFNIIPSVKITKDNLAESWQQILHTDLPEDIQAALEE
jgi:ribose transport system substrate-binding protein